MGDSRLLAAGGWKQSEASLRFTCFKHKDTRGQNVLVVETESWIIQWIYIGLWDQKLNLVFSLSKQKFVSQIFLQKEAIILMQIIEIKRKLACFLQHRGENISGISAVLTHIHMQNVIKTPNDLFWVICSV